MLLLLGHALIFFGALASVNLSLALQSPVKRTRRADSPAESFLSTTVLEQNRKRHEEAVKACEKLFPFNFLKQDFDNCDSENVKWHPYSLPSGGTTLLPPFGFQDLARVSKQPLLSANECALLVEEAENAIQQGWVETGASRYGTPANRVGVLLPLESLPASFDLLNYKLLPRIFNAVCSASIECLHKPSTLRLGGARIVCYNADAGQVELGFHRDFLLLTANIALNDPDEEFTGGGTIIEALSSSEPIRLPKGHALLHPGDVRHAAAPITSGKRYVLVLFIIDSKIIPHERYLGEYGERAMIMASQASDLNEKDWWLSRGAEFYADAYRCGGRVDRGIFPYFYYKAGAASLSK